MRLKLAVVVMGLFAAIAVSGASAADFEGDNGACRETPGEAAVLRCPTGYVGVPYEIEIESEEGSGCEPYDWFEVVNSSLPTGLSMSRDGVISGVPTGAGLTRFWLWNHDLTAAEGGPSWCEREDRSEREFSIPIDPGLAIVNPSVKPATVGQPYTETLATKQVVSLNPLTGPDVQATWSLQSGALPPGITFPTSGVLSGTPTSEGSYEFVVKAQNGSPVDTETYTLTVRQPVVVKSPFDRYSGRTRDRGSFREDLHRNGRERLVCMVAVLRRVALRGRARCEQGHDRGTPQTAGNFAFGLSATDARGAWRR